MTFQKECNCIAKRNNIKVKSWRSSRVGKHYIYLLFAFLFFSGMAKSQQHARNAVYAEFASRGPGYSINYDRIFRQGNKLDYSFNAGFYVGKNAFAFPVGIHFITGEKDHHAEFGVTFIPYIDHKHYLIGSNTKTDADKYLYINPGIGYRYQKNNTGLFLKALIGPSLFLDPPSNDFWNMDPKLYAFGCVGIGVSF